MSNNSTWPSPDQQVAGQGRQDVHGTYLLDPNTQKATAPGAGTQYKDGDATSANPVGTMPVFDNGGTISRVSVANPLPVSATVTPAANQRVNAHAGDFVDGAISTLGTLADAAVTNPATNATVIAYLRGILTQLADTLADGDFLTTIATNTTGIATQATLAQVKTDLDTLVTNTADLLADGDNLATIATNTTGAATAANQATANTSLASIKTDLDTLVTNTADLLADGDFLTTIATNTTAGATRVPNAATSGGSMPFHAISASGTNATNLKNATGQVYGLSISNSNASARFFKLYNKASAPTVGTDTPALTLQVPGNSTVIRTYPLGLSLVTGISWAITTGIADADTGGVGTDQSIDIDYK